MPALGGTRHHAGPRHELDDTAAMAAFSKFASGRRALRLSFRQRVFQKWLPSAPRKSVAE